MLVLSKLAQNCTIKQKESMRNAQKHLLKCKVYGILRVEWCKNKQN